MNVQYVANIMGIKLQCDKSEDWYDMECAGLDSDSLPNIYVCGNCICSL